MRRALVLALVASVAACGGPPEAPSPVVPAAGATTPPEPEAEPTPDPAPAPDLGPSISDDAEGAASIAGPAPHAVTVPVAGSAHCPPPPPPAGIPTVTLRRDPAPSIYPFEIVRRVIRRERAALIACYEQSAPGRACEARTARLGMTLRGDGSVGHLAWAGAPELRACAQPVIEGLAFAEPQGGGVVRIPFDLVFEP